MAEGNVKPEHLPRPVDRWRVGRVLNAVLGAVGLLGLVGELALAVAQFDVAIDGCLAALPAAALGAREQLDLAERVLGQRGRW